MFDLPLDPQIGLDDTIAFHERLSAQARRSTRSTPCASTSVPSRADASPLPRRRLSRFRSWCPTFRLRTLDALSSGPTSPDHSTVDEVREIIEKYNLDAKLPRAVQCLLRARRPSGIPRKQELAPSISRPIPTDRSPAGTPVHLRRQSHGRRRSLPRFGFRGAAFDSRPGRKCPGSRAEGRLLCRSRQLLRRLGLRGRRPLPARSLSRPALAASGASVLSPAAKSRSR